MASQSTPPSTFSAADGNLMRLRCIHTKVTTKVLHFVFAKGCSDKPQSVPLLDYYETKGIASSRFKRGMFSQQIQKINSDPSGASFDITLLYSCLRKGSHGLATDNDNKWLEGNSSLESSITKIKSKRNCIAHEEIAYTSHQLLKEVQQVRDILSSILNLAGTLYQIPIAEVFQEITNLDCQINKYLCDDLTAQDFEDYKKQLLFPAQSEYVNKDGLNEVLEQYDRSGEGEVSTVNHLVDTSFPVNIIYTHMVLEKETTTGVRIAITFENVLAGENQNRTDSIVVINGDAGVGKTTLIKKIMSDWRSKNSTMNHLTNYDHLLKIECRNSTIKSFNELLHHFMPKVSRHFKQDDLQKVMLAQMVLIIMDGLDELNESSALLFKEVLHLHKVFGITVLITTRPEKLKYLEHHVKSQKIKMKQIQLLGVPMGRREEFVRKYHHEVSKNHIGSQDIKGLLDYLNKTQHRLSDLWRLPYNLTLLTILWAYNHMTVTSINTAPELYREIYELHRSKLKDRLQSYRFTSHLSESERERIIDSFIFLLARESLIGMKDNKINLDQKTYEKLKKDCSHIPVPIEEMISAFLRRVPGKEITYGFPHKGLQDFLAALYIWMVVTGKNQSYDVQKVLEGFNAVLIQNNVPASVSQTILSLKEKELKEKPQNTMSIKGLRDGRQIRRLFTNHQSSTIINDIMCEIHEGKNYAMPKFQNMLISLIGMFYLEKNAVESDVKLETMNLLQKTGVRDSEAWIRILNSVKCDEYVATFISKQPNVLNGHIHITDSSVSARLSLMQALQPPFKNAKRLRIDIDINHEIEEALEVLQLISLHQFKVNRILITDDNYKHYTFILRNLQTPLHDAEHVNIDIEVSEDIVELQELLKVIREKNFRIRTLKTKMNEIQINDNNFEEYMLHLKLLPQIAKGAYDNSVKIRIYEKIPKAEELLEQISRNQLTVYINLLSDFLNPMFHSQIGNTINKVFKRCQVPAYLGALTPEMNIPKTVSWLALSVSADNCHLLSPFLKSRPHLSYLSVCIPLQVNEALLKPLPCQQVILKAQHLLAPDTERKTTYPPTLFLPDVWDTRQDILRVAKITNRLQPVKGSKRFYGLYFPRCKLQPKGIKDLLNEIDVNVMMFIVFPSRCRPSSSQDEYELQQLAKSTFEGTMGIIWGSSGSGLFNLDTWDSHSHPIRHATTSASQP